MKDRRRAGTLPVDPARLRRQFPDLTDDDLAAYVEVTRRILAERDPGARAAITRDVLARGRTARASASADAADRVAAAYVSALEKMQGSARPTN